MFRWFRRQAARPDTALAMVDPRATDAVLFLGSAAAALAGESAAITCLNGRTVVLAAQRADAARIEQAAKEAGGLVEVVSALDAVRVAGDTFQIVVAPDLSAWPRDAWRARFTDAAQLLAPGGRLIAMAGAETTGALARLSKQPPAIDADAIVETLKAIGLVAARKLATANGVHYFEARKAR